MVFQFCLKVAQKYQNILLVNEVGDSTNGTKTVLNLACISLILVVPRGHFLNQHVFENL